MRQKCLRPRDRNIIFSSSNTIHTNILWLYSLRKVLLK